MLFGSKGVDCSILFFVILFLLLFGDNAFCGKQDCCY